MKVGDYINFNDEQSTKNIFIDECGNFGSDFSKRGTSSHFIITAIVIEQENVNKVRTAVEEIRNKHFGNGEMKSSRVSKKKHTKRRTILNELNRLDFKIVSLVIDKRKIRFERSGLRFKPVYYKYLNKLLYKELKLLFPFINVYADTHGNETFMDEFSKYIKSEGEISFFDKFTFDFADSKQEQLIQLADFIGGTISYGFEESKKANEYRDFYELLKEKIISLRQWPPTYENYMKNLEVVEPSKFDKAVAEHCIRAATRYIRDNEKSKEQVITDRIHILQYMLNQIYAYDPNKYIYSDELISRLNKVSNVEYEKHTFMTNIIARLRDSSVIISSSSTGYKIPVKEKELYEYTNKTINQIMTMIERLNKARKRILATTESELDILASENYCKIRRFLDEIYNLD